jgi:hypothetical protein
MAGNIREANKLKQLQGQLEKEKAEHSVIMMQKKDILKKEQDINKKISRIQTEIANYVGKDLTMSEHAILRYVEKVQLVNPNDVPGIVITEELKKMHRVLGNGEYPMGDSGFSLIIKNNIIVTIK